MPREMPLLNDLAKNSLFPLTIYIYLKDLIENNLTRNIAVKGEIIEIAITVATLFRLAANRPACLVSCLKAMPTTFLFGPKPETK